MTHPITLVPGDLTGAQSCRAVQTVLSATGVDLAWEELRLEDAGIDALVAAAHRTRTVLMDFQKGHRESGQLAPIVQLRRTLGTYAAIRPAKTIPAITARHPDVDLVVVRETTEDVYSKLEHESIPGVYESLKVTTRAACERISRFAFEFARKNGRRKVTIVHKANILKKADGLFLRVAGEVAEEFPDIAHEDMIVDALCMRLTLQPERYDVLLCGNLFGDIVGDLVSGLVGGRANAPSMNVGPGGLGVFTVGHDPGPENPISLLFSSILLLRHLGEQDAADRVWAAVRRTMDDGVLPAGIGGDASCGLFAEAVAARLGA